MAEQGSSSSDLPFPAWQRQHKAALLELDPEKLRERVHAAEAAIFNCLQELAQSSGSPDHKAERQAIEDAILGFLIGKRSKESRGNVVEQSAGFADQNRHVLGL